MAARKRRTKHAHYACMTMFSDCLMYHVFQGAPDVVEHMLKIILGIALKVIEVHVEYALKFGTGTGIRMDVHAIDNEGVHYNIEIQNNLAGASIERADYNGAAMKVYFSKRRNRKRIIPRTYVIFITSNGFNCHGRPFYRYSLKGENGEETGVGTEIVFVNGLWRDNTDFGRMMHDFGCADPKQMQDPVFAKRVAYVKYDKNVRRSMDDYELRKYRKAKKEGIKIGEANTQKDIAVNLIYSGVLSEKQIADVTGLSATEIRLLREEPNRMPSTQM